MTRAAIILAVAAVLAGCDLGQDSSESLFRYCLYRAEPASADAIRACRDAAWPQGQGGAK